MLVLLRVHITTLSSCDSSLSIPLLACVSFYLFGSLSEYFAWSLSLFVCPSFTPTPLVELSVCVSFYFHPGLSFTHTHTISLSHTHALTHSFSLSPSPTHTLSLSLFVCARAWVFTQHTQLVVVVVGAGMTNSKCEQGGWCVVDGAAWGVVVIIRLSAPF